MHGDQDRCRVILPFQAQLAGCAAQGREGVLQILDRRQRLAHGHLHAAQVLRLVVHRAPLAGLLVHDQLPVVGVGDIDEEGVVALGHLQSADGQVGVGVQFGGAIGAGAPHRIGGDRGRSAHPC